LSRLLVIVNRRSTVNLTCANDLVLLNDVQQNDVGGMQTLGSSASSSSCSDGGSSSSSNNNDNNGCSDCTSRQLVCGVFACRSSISGNLKASGDGTGNG
jgi:hypothetical protein